MTSGLAKHLLHKKEAVEKQAADLAANGGAPASNLKASVTAEGLSGVRRIRIRDFQVISDGKQGGGGFDLGPAPGELLVAAVAGCLNHGYLLQAAKRNIVLNALVVEAHAVIPAGGFDTEGTEPIDLSFTYTAKVESPASAEELEALRQVVEKNSFVYNVVTRGAPVTGTLENLAGGDAA